MGPLCSIFRYGKALHRCLLLSLTVSGFNSAFAQSISLSLSSGHATPGSTVELEISLRTTGAIPPSALMFTVTYSTADISAMSASAGSAAASAGKSIYCNQNAGSLACILYGLNRTTISDGEAAKIHATVSAVTTNPAIVTGLNSSLASSADGLPLAVQASGGVISTGLSSGGQAGLRFVPLTPCRVIDTRPEYNYQGRVGPFGPPFFAAAETRVVPLPQSTVCRIPTSAKAYVLNVTLVPRGRADFLTIWPTGEDQPPVWTVRSPDGLVVANSAIVKAGPYGSLSVYSSGNTDLVLDIAGYFTDQTGVAGFVYYPLSPCRVVETRTAMRPIFGPFGPPSMGTGETRRFDFPSSSYCQIPQGAAAYSVTITAVPKGPLAFLTAWPAGEARPNVSSLNSPSGRVLANSFIVPASDGGIDVYTYDETDFLIDINGYFAPDNGLTGLYYFPLPQCRVMDTSNPGFPSVFGGPMFADSTSRTLPMTNAPFCPGIPASAKAYAINVTALPAGSPMPYLTAYPAGQPRPVASFLNAFEGQVVTNSVIVPAGTGGAISLYAYRHTNIVLEISGYFGR
ncbi:MAG: hypothetical protein IT166_10580 [Bryobacterales bacterium]|nr:hypothetical protein [Bryobacterales bacterium]